MIAVTARIHGKFFDVSSESLESFGESGGWSSLRMPGDSSSPPLAAPCSELSLRSESDDTLRRDWIESVRLTASVIDQILGS